MALPNAILFPQALLPLYIFEDRYRQMLRDCLASERMFAVALLPRGWEVQQREPHPCPVAGLGVIRAAVANGDGTSNLILQGICRVFLRSYARVRPYRIARIEPLSTLHAREVSVEPLAQKVAELLGARAEADMALPEHVVQYLTNLKDAEHLADLVSFTLLSDCQAKQELLETMDLRVRVRRLIELLDREKTQVLYWKKLQSGFKGKDIGCN